MTQYLQFMVFGFCLLIQSAHAVDLPPLHEAVRTGNSAAVKALLAKGADVNFKDSHYGNPPLHWAAQQGKTEIAKLLLAKGADINIKNTSDESVLEMATTHGHKEFVEFLLVKGADVNAKGFFGWTALHSAAFGGHQEIVSLLLTKGADAAANDKNGQTPRSLAAEKKYQQIVEQIDLHILKQGTSPRQLLEQLSAKLHANPDDSTRRMIIKLASELHPAPAIHEEARKHFVEGTTIVKAAKNPAQQLLAVQSFSQAVSLAPWWGDAYYNLGVAQELAEKYDEAERAFNFYLLTNPSAAEKREVQDRIYALAAKRKLSGAE